jgi:hypothetical protein
MCHGITPVLVLKEKSAANAAVFSGIFIYYLASGD